MMYISGFLPEWATWNGDVQVLALIVVVVLGKNIIADVLEHVHVRRTLALALGVKSLEDEHRRL